MAQEDLAQELELREWEIRNMHRPESVTYKPGDEKYGPEQCEECGDDMPELRRAMGATLCTICKSVQERRAKGY